MSDNQEAAPAEHSLSVSDLLGPARELDYKDPAIQYALDCEAERRLRLRGLLGPAALKDLRANNQEVPRRQRARLAARPSPFPKYRHAPPAMRSDEENIARRAWASKHFRQRPADAQLRLLLYFPLTRAVYHRAARKALVSRQPQELTRALADLHGEVNRVLAAKLLVKKHMPLLYKLAA